MQNKLSFLITIDTEGDNMWARPQTVTTKNASYLRRFQELCEKYKLRPTYLTNFEMANSLQFQEFGKDILRRDVGEIGTHLHAWNTPPLFQLTKNDMQFHPFLIEYPEEIIREKIEVMTGLLENIFGIKMLSHRAGRWGFDERYARILIENGYKVDCSVTPHVSWKNQLGDPKQSGGTDYTKFPENAYFINPLDICSPDGLTLLEVPVSIEKLQYSQLERLRIIFKEYLPFKKVFNYFFPPLIWLRPNGKNLNSMLTLLRNAVDTENDYVEFMLHSSEFMPGGSPTFMSEDSIEKLYGDLDVLFNAASNYFIGCTLAEYYEKYKNRVT